MKQKLQLEILNLQAALFYLYIKISSEILSILEIV